MIKHMIEGPLAGAKKFKKTYEDQHRRIYVRIINNKTITFLSDVRSIYVDRDL